ncbi:MAG: hypothetical protein JOZ57_03655 [Abitibacteriaceae bacterium]|nr:hypothetical protein [Abditibacteriaceae bacterium]
MKIFNVRGRLCAEACLSLGAVLFCCGVVVALTQNDNQRPVAPDVGAASDTATSHAWDGTDDLDVMQEAKAYRPPLSSSVMIRGRTGVYHWHRDCPLWRYESLNKNRNYGNRGNRDTYARLVTRAQAEAQRFRPCGICRDLDKKSWPP